MQKRNSMYIFYLILSCFIYIFICFNLIFLFLFLFLILFLFLFFILYFAFLIINLKIKDIQKIRASGGKQAYQKKQLGKTPIWKQKR